MREIREALQQSLGDAYVIERELPRGGMSRVFAARETALGRVVVLKVLSPELAATLSAERFKREITLAARLQHPHIVPLLSTGQAADSLFYTMPLVDGESLRERMSRERPMPIAAVEQVLTEVASALAYAHDQGVVHRDIKPENVMFFHGSAVVLDFGIGKALTAATHEQEETTGRITQRGMSLGTPTYISPEQAVGDPDLDHRADIYSLGVMAYEMLCGHPPFSGRSPQAVMAAHANQPPEPVARRRADVPPYLAALVMRCLEKVPAHRPKHASEVVTAVRDQRVSGAHAARPSLLGRLPAWVPWTIAAAATLAAVYFARRR
ncbi:MAG TPA: serine/threonine-protein kinase [Gemmatimonadaceae bacterium]|nr:serine/threonine-protein kinase [Gemmatimonadaceae bacterium]